ncbi:MAG: glycoside hydrolase family 95 protein [Amphiplicatus sp.]
MTERRFTTGLELSRRDALAGALAVGLFFSKSAAALPRVAPPTGASKLTLWYRQPAHYWVEALPVGNGGLGAMIYGGTTCERLQLNEDTFWAGGPYDPSSAEAREALPEVRKLIFDGRFAEAQAIAQEKMMARPIRQMSYQTLGELALETGAPARAEEYRRWLDLETAEAVVEWRAGERRFRRTVYASAADNVIVVDCEADGEPFDLAIVWPEGEASIQGDVLWRVGGNKGQHGVDGALSFATGVKVIAKGGEIAPRERGIGVRAARRVVLLIAAATSYRDWRNVDADPVAAVREALDQASQHSPEELRTRAVAEHRRLFDGFDLDLGPDPFPDIATDERIRYSHERGRDDPFLAALYVQYARYLLISCSRPGSQPANLQGLWNDSDSPPWGSKYTININTEMNYWPAERLGLGECVEPLIRLVEDLAESGRRTARINYGARGWVAHHNTDLWRATAPIDAAFYGLWPMGGAWLCQHLWDRWDYTRERAVLERIYPLMRDAGLFFLDTLIEHPDGSGLVTCPSMSPENAHRPGVSLCAGPAVDRQILRELFANIIAAAEELGVDEGLRHEFAAARARLPADRIGEAGQLQEWLDDWDMTAPEIQHRHVSHLYAVHPGHEIGPETPELYKAARRSLEIRGDDATGWGIGWRINLWARLGDGLRAYTVLRKLFGPDRTYPNMFDAHPPFQIDGNFSGAAGVIEMLARDRPQALELLPALPPAWTEGAIANLRLRGAMSLDMRWRQGRVVEAAITALRDAERVLIYNGRSRRLHFKAGRTTRLPV